MNSKSRVFDSVFSTKVLNSSKFFYIAKKIVLML